MNRSGCARPSKADRLSGLGFVLVLVLLIAVSILGGRGPAAEGSPLAAIAERTVGLGQIAAGFADLHGRVAAALRDKKPGGGEAAATALRDLRTRLLTLRDASLEPARRDAANRLIELTDGYGADLGRLAPDRGGTDAVMADLEAKARHITEAIQADLQNAAQALAAAKAAEAEAADLSGWLIGGLTLLALVIGLLSLRHGRRQMAQLTATIDAVTHDLSVVFSGLAEGDLTKKVGSRHHRSFEKMADDVNATVEKLAGMVSRINDAAGAISTAAGEVAAGGSDLAERTEHQAAALEQTAAALAQLASTFKSYCDHAHEANTMVSEARSAGSQGVTVVAAAIEAMGRIVEASEKIKGIIRVTEEISRRINMLAINAAVEAARAGEAGKGFGVVAREVGSLAERSAQASQQIKELIVNSDSQIQQGVQMVTQSGEALQVIVGSVGHAAALFNDIAISAAAQSGMLHEINVAVAQLDETTQMNAALAEQTCAASQSMRQESSGLKELVSFFMVDPNAVQQGLGRDIVLIESTKLDHISFMARIREAVTGERDTRPEDVANHHQCRLGKWYDGIERPVVRLNPVYRALERPHALVHDTARGALQCHVTGDAAGCERALREMEQASQQVLALIDDLAADLRNHEADQDGWQPAASGATGRTAAAKTGAGRQPHRPRQVAARQQPRLEQSRLEQPRLGGVLRHADEANDHDWAEF